MTKPRDLPSRIWASTSTKRRTKLVWAKISDRPDSRTNDPAQSKSLRQIVLRRDIGSSDAAEAGIGLEMLHRGSIGDIQLVEVSCADQCESERWRWVCHGLVERDLRRTR